MSGLPLLYSDMSRWGVIEADTLVLLTKLPTGSVDAVITDPPYGISFNGMAWDGKQMRDLAASRRSEVSGPEAFEHFTYLWAIEALRVLKPGGHLVSFGAARTFHRLTSAVEDTGFQIRDVLMWLYSSGVPKSRRYPNGMGSALKPAYEPILLARKKPEGSLESNQEKHGTGLLDIALTEIFDPESKDGSGRWPANVTFTHHTDCDPQGCVAGCPGGQIDRQGSSRTPASRIFFSAKAQRSEREAGLDGLPTKTMSIMRSNGKARPRANTHQTVKPVELMRWLTRLVSPAGGVVFDPFTGSGSTGVAAVLEGRQFIGIEKEPEYTRIASHRIRHWAEESR